LCHRNKELAVFCTSLTTFLYFAPENSVFVLLNTLNIMLKYKDFVPKHHAQNRDIMLKMQKSTPL